MAGGQACWTEHRIAGIAIVDRPRGIKMLGNPPASGAGVTVNDQISDTVRHAKIGAVASGLKRRHQRLGQMHV